MADPTTETDKERYARLHRENMAQIATRLGELTHYVYSERVIALLNALRNHHGCVTPAEEFVLDTLSDYSLGGFTPEVAERSLKSFRENFDDAVEVARVMLAQYPNLLTPPPAAPEGKE